MKPVVLFDGVCNLCNASVQFLLRRDRRGELRFASLQSGVGRELLARHGLRTDLQSVVLIEGGQAFTESEAALRIARHLPFPWRLVRVLRILPRRSRDALYRSVAERRYRIFGRREHCPLPDPAWRERFLDS